MDQNVGELQRQTSPNYDHSIRHAFAEYSEFSGQKKNTNEELLRRCNKRTLGPSLRNGNGDRYGMFYEKTLSHQREQLYTGHQKARERGGNQEHRGEGQSRASLTINNN